MLLKPKRIIIIFTIHNISRNRRLKVGRTQRTKGAAVIVLIGVWKIVKFPFRSQIPAAILEYWTYLRRENEC